MDLISVIIPVYNAEKTISRCLDSILSQDYSNLEVIVINDGSTDDSASILDIYAGKDKRIKVIHTENRGVSAARNAGLDIAKGSYIGFMDADDWAEKEMFRYMYEALIKEQADISICGYWHQVGTVDEIDPYSGFLSSVRHVLSPRDAYAAALKPDGFKGFLATKLFKAAFFSKDGCSIRLDESIHICEDLLCVCECICHAQKVVYDPVPLFHYVSNINSATNSPFSPRKASLLNAGLKIAALTERNFPELKKEAVCLYISGVAHTFLTALSAGSGTQTLQEHFKRIRKYVFVYLFKKGNPVKYKFLTVALAISPSAARVLWMMFKKKFSARKTKKT